MRVIDLRNEQDIWVFLLDLLNRPCPKLTRHHLRHVATETINLLTCPEEQDMQHLVPCIRDGIKLLFSSTLVEDTIVEFHGLIPVVDGWCSHKAIITRSTSRILLISLNIEIRSKLLTRHIVEVVEWGKCPIGIVIRTQIHYSTRVSSRVILAGYVVRYKVDNHAHICLMSTFY